MRTKKISEMTEKELVDVAFGNVENEFMTELDKFKEKVEKSFFKVMAKDKFNIEDVFLVSLSDYPPELKETPDLKELKVFINSFS